MAAAGGDLPRHGERRHLRPGPRPATSASGWGSARISTALRREAIGGLRVEDAVPLDAGRTRRRCSRPRGCSAICPRWSWTRRRTRPWCTGGRWRTAGAAMDPGDAASCCSRADELVAVARRRGGLAPAHGGAGDRREASQRPRRARRVARRRNRRDRRLVRRRAPRAPGGAAGDRPAGARRRAGRACWSPSSRIRSRW